MEPGLMKMHINSTPNKNDTQKWTLAYIWYEICWQAYDTQFSHTYDTRLPHNPNPTHRV